MQLSEDDFFSPSEVVDEDRVLQEDPIIITFNISSDKMEYNNLIPYIRITISTQEDDTIRIKEKDKNLIVNCTDIRKGVAKLIQFVSEEYYQTRYWYKTYKNSDNSMIDSIEMYKNSTRLFTLGQKNSSKEYITEENSFSYEFWEGLYYVERVSSSKVEEISKISPIEGIRYKIKQSQDEAEADLLVYIGKYLLEFYTKDYVLRDDPDLHSLLGFTSVITGLQCTMSDRFIERNLKSFQN